MADSALENGIKKETASHFHIYNGLHEQLSAEDPRNVDKNDSADESGESPLDFSIKPKSSRSYQDEISGSDSISSPASSNENGSHPEYRKNDTEDRIPYFNGSISNESTDNGSAPHESISRNERHHMDTSPTPQIGEPRTAGPNGAVLPGMLSGLQMGLIPNMNMLANSFPAMAALMDSQNAPNGSKSSRPFKAYPKDPLSLPVGSMAVPQYLASFSNFENSMLTQGLNLSSEEIFSVYKQQLMLLREREKYIESLKNSQNSTRTSTITSTPKPSIASSPTSHYYNNNNINKNKGIHNNNGDSNGFNSVVNGATSSASSTPTTTEQLTMSGRRRPRSLPDEQKDELYWERRRKNNEAAKRSRDARRAKEDEIAIRAALLEQENLKLRVEVAALKTETAKLRCMLYNS